MRHLRTIKRVAQVIVGLVLTVVLNIVGHWLSYILPSEGINPSPVIRYVSARKQKLLGKEPEAVRRPISRRPRAGRGEGVHHHRQREKAVMDDRARGPRWP